MIKLYFTLALSFFHIIVWGPDNNAISNLSTQKLKEGFEFINFDFPKADSIVTMAWRQAMVENKEVVVTNKSDQLYALSKSTGDSLYTVATQTGDSVYMNQKTLYDTGLRQKYELQARAQKIGLQELQLRIATISGILLFATIALTICLAFILYRRYKNKEKLNSFNELLLSETHHRVKNNLQMIIGLLSLQKKELNDPELLISIDDNIGRLHIFSSLHDTLFMQGENNAIEMHDFIENIGKSMVDVSLKDLELTIEVPHIILNLNQALTVGLILNELITNSLKHAFNTDKELDSSLLKLLADENIKTMGFAIEISLLKDSSGYIIFNYEDSGLGIVGPAISNEQSMGLQLIKGLSRQLKAETILPHPNHYKLKFKPIKVVN